jgi:hypothetical protein
MMTFVTDNFKKNIVERPRRIKRRYMHLEVGMTPAAVAVVIVVESDLRESLAESPVYQVIMRS